MPWVQLMPCSVVGVTVAKPLLIRSASAPRVPGCSCGAAVHSQMPVEIVPARLFASKPQKIFSFVERLTELLMVKLENCVYFNTLSKSAVFSAAGHVYDRDTHWWSDLFQNDGLSDFMHMWRTLLHYDHLFNRKIMDQDSPCGVINLCSKSATYGCKPNSSGVQLRVGTISTMLGEGDTACVWSPSSSTFALQLALAWARLTMEAMEADESKSSAVSTSDLARASFGVLENWFDLIVLGKLGPLATNSVQIEPEPPSFFEEDSDFSAVCNGSSSVSENWKKLDNAWQSTVQRRMKARGTITIDLNECERGKGLDSLVDEILTFFRNFSSTKD
ncbi:unnamed protein product [Calicophoron daubneyi]|uniref:Uncharacterized protein n=1 Tax=Calicophoron daubneyi TaxID=300641 RepID=A0AAV2T360_CALDB